MNTKLSGAQLVLVPITRVGRNYLPEVQYLRGRLIKYIDFYPVNYLPGVTTAGVATSDDLYLTITNEQGNQQLHYEVPMDRFNYISTLGVRQPICNKISLTNSYINCQDAALVGKMAALVFWYDLPQYSARNTTEAVMTDAISVPLTTAVRYNQLPDIDRLTGKRFRRIMLGTPTVTPDLHSGLDLQKLSNIYLTLRKGTYNVLENVPVALLWQLGMMEKSEFANIIFDFQNSYLTIGGAGTIPNVLTDYVGKSVFFNLQYEAK